MLGIPGSELNDEDIRRLENPLVGGVLLFTRNYRSPEQLTALTQAIRAIKSPPLLTPLSRGWTSAALPRWFHGSTTDAGPGSPVGPSAA